MFTSDSSSLSFNKYKCTSPPPTYEQCEQTNNLPQDDDNDRKSSLPPSYNSFKQTRLSEILNSQSILRNAQRLRLDEVIGYRRRMTAERREYNERMLHERYPVKFVIINGIFYIILSLAAIIVEVFVIMNRSAYYYVCSGFWCGAVYIVTSILSLILVCKRNYCLFIIVFLMHFFSCLASVGGLVIMNCLAILSLDCKLDEKYGCGKLNFYNEIMLIIGVLMTVISLTFFIILNCMLNGCIGGSSNIRRVEDIPSS